MFHGRTRTTRKRQGGHIHPNGKKKVLLSLFCVFFIYSKIDHPSRSPSTLYVFVRVLVPFFRLSPGVHSCLLGNHVNRTEKEGVGLFRYAFLASWHKKRSRKKREEDEEKIEIAERVLLFPISRPERKVVCVCQQYFIFLSLSLFFLLLCVLSPVLYFKTHVSLNNKD